MEGDHGMQLTEVGSKRKSNGVEGHDGDEEKKLKVDEEARNLGVIFATHLERQRLLSSPAEPNESVKLELSRAWELSDS